MINVIHFLQFLLIWVWSINERYRIKLMSHGHISDRVPRFFTFFYQFYTKIIIVKPFWEIYSQRLTIFHYIWNQYVSTNFKRERFVDNSLGKLSRLFFLTRQNLQIKWPPQKMIKSLQKMLKTHKTWIPFFYTQLKT